MLKTNNTYTTIPSDDVITKTTEALGNNNFEVIVVDTEQEAVQKVHELIPDGTEVMTATSETLRTLGLETEINESGKYKSVKGKLNTMDRETQHREMQRLGAAAEYQIGSVHAVTQDGTVIIASNSGSQLPGYVYGSDHVIWVVGAHKIVKDVDEGMKRIYDYVLPKETIRARKAYGLPDEWNSYPSKIVLYNREPNKGRTHLILVKEAMGY